MNCPSHTVKVGECGWCKVATLSAQLEEAKMYRKMAMDLCEVKQKEHLKLEAENVRLRKYLVHRSSPVPELSCRYEGDPEVFVCRCGLSAILNEKPDEVWENAVNDPKGKQKAADA